MLGHQDLVFAGHDPQSNQTQLMMINVPRLTYEDAIAVSEQAVMSDAPRLQCILGAALGVVALL